MKGPPPTDAERIEWANRLMRLPKRQLADRLQELLEALSRVSEECAECNVASYRAIEAMEKPSEAQLRELLDLIQRHSLGGWADAVGTMEVGRPPLPGFSKEEASAVRG